MKRYSIDYPTSTIREDANGKWVRYDDALEEVEAAVELAKRESRHVTEQLRIVEQQRSDLMKLLADAKALQPTPNVVVDQASRAMFVARLEQMQKDGVGWIGTAAVLALLNDCDMLAQR